MPPHPLVPPVLGLWRWGGQGHAASSSPWGRCGWARGGGLAVVGHRHGCLSPAGPVASDQPCRAVESQASQDTLTKPPALRSLGTPSPSQPFKCLFFQGGCPRAAPPLLLLVAHISAHHDGSWGAETRVCALALSKPLDLSEAVCPSTIRAVNPTCHVRILPSKCLVIL